MRIVVLSCLLATAWCVPPVWFENGECGKSMYSNAGDQMNVQRLAGGIEAREHEFPWLVSLRDPDGSYDSHFCGGALINEQWVLTSAGCLDISPDGFTVVTGAHVLAVPNTNQATNNVEFVSAHEQYNPVTNDFDIAVVKLAQPVEIGDRSEVRPVCAPDDAVSYTFQESQFAGWGASREAMIGTAPLENYLRYTVLNITTQQTCASAYGAGQSITDNMLCAGDNSGFDVSGPCTNGDYGGALTYKEANGLFRAVGVSSFGGCETGPGAAPAGFTDVSVFNSWITSKLEKN